MPNGAAAATESYFAGQLSGPNATDAATICATCYMLIFASASAVAASLSRRHGDREPEMALPSILNFDLDSPAHDGQRVCVGARHEDSISRF